MFRYNFCNFSLLNSVGGRALHLGPTDGDHQRSGLRLGDHHSEAVLRRGQKISTSGVSEADHAGEDDVSGSETFVHLYSVLLRLSDVLLPDLTSV